MGRNWTMLTPDSVFGWWPGQGPHGYYLANLHPYSAYLWDFNTGNWGPRIAGGTRAYVQAELYRRLYA